MAFKILDRVAGLFQHDNQGRVLVTIPDGHVVGGDTAGDGALHGSEGYFRVWISRMFLAHDREWFSTRYPSVAAFTSFTFGDQAAPVEIAQVAGPEHLKDVDAAHLDRVISVNQIVSPLTPFRGGSVELEVGLLSIEARDDMRRFLNAIGTVSSLLAVPQLSTALTIADKIATGAKELADADGNQLKVGYQNTFVGDDDEPGDPAGNELKDRYVAVINAPANDARYAPDRLWPKDGGVEIGDDATDTDPLTGVDWLVIWIETRASRDDEDSLTSVTGPLKTAIKALGGDNQQADALARQAIVAALNCEDLVPADRQKFAARVKQTYVDAKAAQSLTPTDALTVTSSTHQMRLADVRDVAPADNVAELFDV